MSNPHRGAVSFEANGAPHTLRFSANALVAVEEAFNLEGIAQIGEILNEKLSMKALRQLFQIGMLDGATGTTLEQAGEVISDVGVTRAAELIAEAMQRAFPEAEAAANPPKTAKA